MPAWPRALCYMRRRDNGNKHPMITVGSHGIYEWLATDGEFDILEACPEIVLGKYIVTTSIDSGPLTPSEKEAAAGWRSHGKLAYSPKIQDAKEIARAGWDEWYIFENSIDLGISHIDENIFEAPQGNGHVNVFVNYGSVLHPPERNLADLFWPQLERISPESYVADNYYLTFVSMNRGIFSLVRNAVEAVL
jgi:hypothetical protein